MKVFGDTAKRGRRRILFFLTLLIVLLQAGYARAATPPSRISVLNVVEKFTSQGQRFSCSTDVPEAACLRELRAVRDRLVRYHAEQLGPWHWVLVCAEDWKPLLRDLGMLATGPAMTSVVDRETLLEESLFAPSAARAAELWREFHCSLEVLLVRALTHELGHALCDVRDEVGAEQAAEQVRRGMRPVCSSVPLMADARSRGIDARR